MKRFCLHCRSELVKIYGESATRAAKRRYCNRACVDAAKQAGDGRLTEERMPWPEQYASVDWRMRSSLAGLMELGELAAIDFRRQPAVLHGDEPALSNNLYLGCAESWRTP